MRWEFPEAVYFLKDEETAQTKDVHVACRGVFGKNFLQAPLQ